MEYDLTNLQIPDFQFDGYTGPNNEAVYEHDTADCRIDIEYFRDEAGEYNFVVTYWDGTDQEVIFSVDEPDLIAAFDKLIAFVRDPSKWGV